MHYDSFTFHIVDIIPIGKWKKTCSTTLENAKLFSRRRKLLKTNRGGALEQDSHSVRSIQLTFIFNEEKNT
jgi:hypothetical protein